MKPIFLVTALAGVASAHAHAHLARQVDDVSDECIEAQNAIFSANYPTPTLLSSLSSDYYATATPTATHGEVDCGWVTAIPKSSYADVAEKLDEHYLWEQSSSNMDILSDIADNCDFGTDADGPDPSVPVCVKEWNALVDRISAGRVPYVERPLSRIVYANGRASTYRDWVGTCVRTRLSRLGRR